MAAAPCGAGPNQRLPMLATARLRALDTGSVTALRDRLFFAFQKKVESATSQRRDIALKMAAAPCGAGPNQRLPMLATARLRALDTGSVTALRDRFFFAFQKS
jgi:hypothetical protein